MGWRHRARSGRRTQLVIALVMIAALLAVPRDLRRALDVNEAAAGSFDGLSYSHRREYFEWSTEAKRAETRERRIGKAITMLSEGRTQR